MPSTIGASHASPNSPALQVRGANSEAKGAQFGALVSAAAKAKHSPPPPPAVEEPPALVGPSQPEETGATVDITA